MDYSSQILKNTKRSLIYMNVNRVLRYELKGLFYLVLAVLLVLLWQAFFNDYLFGTDVWLYFLITVLSAPFLYCCFRPVRLMTVVRALDSQLKLQQRLETFFENLQKSDEVVNLQQKETFYFLKSIDMTSVVKFRWPFEARIIPFILLSIFLLFAGKGLFDSERKFITGSDLVNEEDINYQIVKNPFKKRSNDPSGKVNESHVKRNRSDTRKLFKTSAGDSVGLAKLGIPKNDKLRSNLNSADYKAIDEQNKQREKFIENNQANNRKREILSHKETKILRNPDANTNRDRMKRYDTSELSASSKRSGPSLTEADVINAKSSLNKKTDRAGSSGVNNTTAANDDGSAGSGSSSVNRDAVKRSMLAQHSFVGDINHIEEMISKNCVQPSLREYVKKYFVSLSE
jgi:hypothetical protein